MMIEATARWHIEYVAARMRERDRAEFMPLTDADTHEQLVELLLARYDGRTDLVTALDGDEPVAVGGCIQHRPNVASLLMFATDRFPRVSHPLTRFIRKTLFPAARRHGAHRIEAVSLSTYDEAHRWIEMLGLSQEATLRGYGRDGQDYVSFAWISSVLSCNARMVSSETDARLETMQCA